MLLTWFIDSCVECAARDLQVAIETTSSAFPRNTGKMPSSVFLPGAGEMTSSDFPCGAGDTFNGMGKLLFLSAIRSWCN